MCIAVKILQTVPSHVELVHIVTARFFNLEISAFTTIITTDMGTIIRGKMMQFMKDVRKKNYFLINYLSEVHVNQFLSFVYNGITSFHASKFHLKSAVTGKY